MNAGHDVERLIAGWLAEEAPGRAPDRILSSAGRVIDGTRQRRFVAAWRDSTLFTTRGLVAAAVMGLVLVGGVLFYLKGVPSGNVGASPSPSTSASPTPAPSPSPSPSASEGPTLDGTACGLVSKPEVLAASGHNYPHPVPHGSGAQTSCMFEREGGDVFLRLTYTSSGGGAAFDLAKAAPDIVSVADMGDEAFFDPATESLFVLVGDSLVQVSPNVIIGSTYTAFDFAKELGALIAGRL